MNRMRTWMPAMLLVATTLPASAAPPRAAEVAPERATAVLAAHELKGLDGKTLPMASLKGEVVVINFWATWCAPCRRELPELNSLHREIE